MRGPSLHPAPPHPRRLVDDGLGLLERDLAGDRR